MTELFEFNAQLRTGNGTSDARRLRRQEIIPAIVYGANQEPTSITLPHKDLLRALDNEAVYSHILTLNIGDKQESVVLKAVQRHPYKPKITHVDFLRVDKKAKLTLSVPLHFTNEDTCPGVKAGGNLVKSMNEIEIQCLPKNLPEYIEVSLAELALSHSLHISDIQLPEGVELNTALTEDNDHSIVSVQKPKVAAEPEDSAEDAGSASDEKAAE